MVASLALPAAGCGGDDDFANASRPPTEITVSAAIAPSRVSVSPRRIGAGPIELLASNQTARSQRVTLRALAEPTTAGTPPTPLEQRTGPINPGDTASLKADLATGSYSVSIGGGDIAPARLEVGPARDSGQNRPVQP